MTCAAKLAHPTDGPRFQVREQLRGAEGLLQLRNLLKRPQTSAAGASAAEKSSSSAVPPRESIE
jgi:hypothetical protein